MSNAKNLSKLHVLATHISNLIGLSNSKPAIDAKVAEQAILVGMVFDYALSTLPAGYAWCDGSTLLSDTPYPNLRAALISDGFPHGQDGSGNPKLPDSRGRVSAGKDNMGGTAANRLTAGNSGINGATLGATGGAEAVTLTSAQSGVPAHSHTASSTHSLATAAAGGHSHTVNGWMQFGGSHAILSDGGQDPGPVTTDTAPNHTHSITGSISTTINNAAAANASQAHTNTQPTIVFNKIIKT